MNGTPNIADQKARAADAGLAFMSPKSGVLNVASDLAFDLYHNNPDNARLREAATAVYKQINGITPPPKVDNIFTNHYLKGPPGHGKSAIFDQAVKMFCDLSGMNLVTSFKTGDTLGENDFAYVKVELAGETSPVTLFGLPDKQAVDGNRNVMAKILNAAFDTAKTAGGSFFLFDDIHGAHESVKTALLGLMRERAYQGHEFPATGVGLAGNLGDMDGNTSSEEQAAILGRSVVSYVENTHEQWIEYVTDQYREHPSKMPAYISSFLAAHPEHFAGDSGDIVDRDRPRPQPRTWSALLGHSLQALAIQESGASDRLSENGGFYGLLRNYAEGQIGKRAASDFTNYIEQMMTHVAPLARAAVHSMPDKMDEEDLKKLAGILGTGVKSNGETNQSIQQYQYGAAVAAEASQLLDGTLDGARNAMRAAAHALYGVGAADSTVKVRDAVISHSFHLLGSRHEAECARQEKAARKSVTSGAQQGRRDITQTLPVLVAGMSDAYKEGVKAGYKGYLGDERQFRERAAVCLSAFAGLDVPIDDILNTTNKMAEAKKKNAPKEKDAEPSQDDLPGLS